MISIVYSTRKSNPNYQKHIKNTLGIKDFEIIEIENPGKYSLTEAYNLGLEKSKFDIVVFIHDDLIFRTKEWGNILIKILGNEKNNFGMIGLAGSCSVSENQGMWGDPTEKACGIVKHFTEKGISQSNWSKEFPNKILEVVILDGLFIAINKKKLFEKFDDSLNDFHFYDLDFCLANFLKGIKIGVTTDIRVLHMSLGNPNEKWEQNRKYFLEKYRNVLPKGVEPRVFCLEKIDYEKELWTNNKETSEILQPWINDKEVSETFN